MFSQVSLQLSAADRERLLSALPDVPRWVELRGALLDPAEEVAIFGPPGDCAVVCGDGSVGTVVAIVGHPEPRWIRDAAALHPSAELLVPPEARGHVERLAGEPLVRAVLHLLPPDRELPLEHPTRILTLEDAGALRHVPDAQREELLGALARVPLAVACADGVPVAFCYAGSRTETLWDISIDTLETHRRRGYAAAAVAAMARHLAPAGRRPVWGAAEDNPASMLLARKLGFEPVDELFLLPASAILSGR
jgi:GNAT superfamily N-acetyltransferase